MYSNCCYILSFPSHYHTFRLVLSLDYPSNLSVGLLFSRSLIVSMHPLSFPAPLLFPCTLSLFPLPYCFHASSLFGSSSSTIPYLAYRIGMCFKQRSQVTISSFRSYIHRLYPLSLHHVFFYPTRMYLCRCSVTSTFFNMHTC